VLQVLAAESMLQGRMLRPASELVRWAGPALVALLMFALWRRISALGRVAALSALAIAAEIVATLVQVKLPVMVDTSLLHLTIVACFGAIALDEIDFRGLLSRIAEKRFRRITMSLGDGVVCVDQHGAITVWNPGATAIFGYVAEEMIGQPFARIIGGPAAGRAAFSVLHLPTEKLTSSGGIIMELDGRRKNGEVFALEACFSGWHGTDGRHYGAILRDISVRKREEARIRYLAEHDTLTGLANRNALHAQLCERIPEAQTNSRQLALLAISIDKFQLMNDMMGHDYGDQVIRAVAERLTSLVKTPNLLARLGDEEFALIVCEDNAIDQAIQLAGRICRRFTANPVSIGMRDQSIRLSVGVAMCPDHGTTADELIGNAHLALDRAKAAQRGGYVLFERGIRVELESRLILEAELARAIDLNEFELFYQPQVTLEDGRLTGAEALIRWRHPARGLLAPSEFMTVVNTSSISDRIAFWVMRTACRQARKWMEQGHQIPVAVNLSPSQLRSDEIVLVVGAVLAETGCPPQLLELEVTEDILVDETNAVEIFRRLREIGVRVLLDDFGTGYASLSYLRKFPLDGLKIDRTFVQELQTRSDDTAIVGAIVGLSKLLSLTVVAEGIEDRATNELLLRMGCKQGQGYYFGRPTPATEFERKYLNGPAGHGGADPPAMRTTAA
jgi:diguanylate cyclase (GGDEF)-like protein/PAS domain S-box-containing protein